jgi:hypothetical protein
MRINGAWLSGDDEVLRPTVPGLVRLQDGQWVEVAFLLDGGADRTVFSAGFRTLLQGTKGTASDQILLAGVGGNANSITVETAIGFAREGRPNGYRDGPI